MTTKPAESFTRASFPRVQRDGDEVKAYADPAKVRDVNSLRPGERVSIDQKMKEPFTIKIERVVIEEHQISVEGRVES